MPEVKDFEKNKQTKSSVSEPGEGKKKKEPKIWKIETSTIMINGTLYEHCYDGFNQFFIYEENGTFKTKNEILYRYNLYKPYNDGLVKKGIILLPDGVDDYNTVEDLIKEIIVFINKYMELDKVDQVMCACYIIFTYLYDKFNACPYFRAMGFFESGKSRYLDTVGKLCYKPMIMCGISTPASISRIIDKYKGTLIADEVSGESKKGWYETESILLLRFEKGRPFTKCRKEDPSIIEGFDVYGGSILATYKPFKNLGLESRCYSITLSGKDREDIPLHLPPEFDIERKELVRKLLGFRFKNINKKIKPRVKGLEEFNDRIKQAMAPLFAIVPNSFEGIFIMGVRKHEAHMIEQKQISIEGQVVVAMGELFTLGVKRLTPKLISEQMEHKGFEASAWKVGHKLKTLGFKTHRYSGGNYVVIDLKHWKRTMRKFGLTK